MMKRLFPLLLFLTPALLFADITGDGNPNYSAKVAKTTFFCKFSQDNLPFTLSEVLLSQNRKVFYA